MGALFLPNLPGQVDANSLHTKYGQPAEETFTVRPGIVMRVMYGDNQRVCKLELRPSRNDAVIPATLIEEILNEILPPSVRGTPGRQMLSSTGCCSWKMSEYEGMTIGQSAQDVRPDLHAEAPNSLAVVQFEVCARVKQ
jgi:hypothetical protein